MQGDDSSTMDTPKDRFQAVAHRIKFDVTHQRQQVPLAVHHRREVAPFPEGVAKPIGGIKIEHVPPTHRLKDLADRVPTFRRCQPVDVVGHPNIGMDSQTLLGCRLGQGPTKKPVVLASAKEGLPVIAALDDVLRLARNDEAGGDPPCGWLSWYRWEKT